MFRGQHTINMDAKGRLAIPAKYREVLAADSCVQLVATIDIDSPCLLIYPFSEWQVIEDKVQALPSFNPTARKIQRLFLGHATEFDMDASGRVLLPHYLREHASLSKEVVLIGQGNKLELWDKEKWDEQRALYLAEMNDAENLPAELLGLSL